MAWLYILKSKSRKFYVGSTPDLERRFRQHLSGHTHSTKRLHPEQIIFKQEYKTLEEARSIELRLKKLKRKDYLEKIIKDGYIKIQAKTRA